MTKRPASPRPFAGMRAVWSLGVNQSDPRGAAGKSRSRLVPPAVARRARADVTLRRARQDQDQR